MMKKLAIFAVAAAVLAGASARGASSGSGPVVCNGTIDGGSYRGGVVVPQGAECNLWNARISGDVRAESGSTLNAVADKVLGSVIGDHALVVQVRSSTVHGTITITAAGDSPGGITEAYVAENTIWDGVSVTGSAGTILVDWNNVKSGDVSVTDNFIPPFTDYPNGLFVRQNTVAGNMTVSRNTGSSPDAAKEVSGNEVTGTLRCEDNELPFTGGPNTAGSVVGQCF
jgi:hypothetical protein